jgi:hypothetical protein
VASLAPLSQLGSQTQAHTPQGPETQMGPGTGDKASLGVSLQTRSLLLLLTV